jgi:hypothetical protein
MSALTFTAEHLARMTLDEVDGWYRQGVVSQAQYEGYRHAWAAGHPGYSLSTGWECEPWPDALVWRDAILQVGE